MPSSHQPDPPSLSPDDGERFTEADLTTEATRRSTMLDSGPKKTYTAEEFHRELAARLVEQARREQDIRDRKAQKELFVRFDDLAGRVDRSNNIKREISAKVDTVDGKVDTVDGKVNMLVAQGKESQEAFGVARMSADDKAGFPDVLRAFTDHQRARSSGMYQWQRVGVIVGIIVGVIVACATLYNTFAGVAHPVTTLGH